MNELLRILLCSVLAVAIAIPLTLLCNKIIDKYGLSGKKISLGGFGVGIEENKK